MRRNFRLQCIRYAGKDWEESFSHFLIRDTIQLIDNIALCASGNPTANWDLWMCPNVFWAV